MPLTNAGENVLSSVALDLLTNSYNTILPDDLFGHRGVILLFI